MANKKKPAKKTVKAAQETHICIPPTAPRTVILHTEKVPLRIDYPCYHG